MNTGLVLSEIWIYPIKSLGGISLTSSSVLPKGLKYDRRFMLVDESGTAMTQRSHPKMALFKLSLQGDSCLIRQHDETLEIPLTPNTFSETLTVQIWADKVQTSEVSRTYSEWFTDLLRIPCRLVFFPEENRRPVDPLFQENGEQVSLADAYPILIIGQSSLDDLNSRLQDSVPMNRFRPNLVFTGGEPYEEDSWKNFRIGNNTFKGVKSCSRCNLITINQDTAVPGAEPLRTLAGYRNKNHKVQFGQNVFVMNAEEIKTGEKIYIDSYR